MKMIPYNFDYQYASKLNLNDDFEFNIWNIMKKAYKQKINYIAK